MSKTDSRAVYPGTFDPITNGHLDIIQRAVHLFGAVTVAVAESARKQPLFTLSERLQMIKEVTTGYASVSVESFPGLLTDYMRVKDGHVIVRGLRAVSDFEYEFQMAMMNRKLNSAIDTIFLMPSEEYFFLTSTLVKEVAQYGGNVASLVPEQVLIQLQAKRGGTDSFPSSSF